MVSHIDDDHIKGIVELTPVLVTASRLNAPAFVKLQIVPDSGPYLIPLLGNPVA